MPEKENWGEAVLLMRSIPADVYYGRGQSVLDRREKIELETLAMRKQMSYDRRANQIT